MLWLLLSFTSCHFSKVIPASVCVWNAMMTSVTPPEPHQCDTHMYNTHTHTFTPTCIFPAKHLLQSSAQHVSFGTSLFASVICFQSQEHDSPPGKKGMGSPLGHLTPLQFCYSLQLFNPFILLDGKLCGAASASCSIEPHPEPVESMEKDPAREELEPTLASSSPCSVCQPSVRRSLPFNFLFFTDIQMLYNVVLFVIHGKVIHMCIYIYYFSDSFPLLVIPRYWIQFPVLYNRSLSFISFIYSRVEKEMATYSSILA